MCCIHPQTLCVIPVLAKTGLLTPGQGTTPDPNGFCPSFRRESYKFSLARPPTLVMFKWDENIFMDQSIVYIAITLWMRSNDPLRSHSFSREISQNLSVSPVKNNIHLSGTKAMM